MKIYIVVKERLESEDFQTVQVFYSAHLTREGAEGAIERYRETCEDEPDFIILEEEVE